MSTDSNPIVSKPAHTLKLTKGAAFILEGLLQIAPPYKTTPQIVSAAKMWQKIRKLNPASHDGVDLEKRQIRHKDESDIDWAHRQLANDEAFKAWQVQPVEVGLTNKQFDICKIGLQWGLKNRDKVMPENNEHVLGLIFGFGLEDDEDDTPAEDEKSDG